MACWTTDRLSRAITLAAQATRNSMAMTPELAQDLRGKREWRQNLLRRHGSEGYSSFWCSLTLRISNHMRMVRG